MPNGSNLNVVEFPIVIYNQKNKELFNWIVGKFSKQSHRLYLACLCGVSFSSLYDVIKFQKTERENSLNLFTKQKHLNSNYLIPVVIKSEKQS